MRRRGPPRVPRLSKQPLQQGDQQTMTRFERSLRRLILSASLAAGVVLLSASVSFAAPTTPTFYPGETVDVFTLHDYGTTGLTISLFSENGGSVNQTLPLTYVTQITTTGFLGNRRTYDEFSFTMPSLGTRTRTLGALIYVPGGAVYTRFVGYGAYPNNYQYGTDFAYDATAPAGQMPEVPYAAALPLVAGALAQRFQ